MVRIALSGETRKALVARLQQADANHATRLVRRIHALLDVAEGEPVWETAQLLGVGEQTVRDWLRAFVLKGVASSSSTAPRRPVTPAPAGRPG